MSTPGTSQDPRHQYEDQDHARSSPPRANLIPKGSAFDLEGQASKVRASREQGAAEYEIPTSTKYGYLSLYFALNLALTIYNKAVLGKVRQTLRSDGSATWCSCPTDFPILHSSPSHGY